MLKGKKLDQAKKRRKVTTQDTTVGHTWTANSPEFNVAEHAVAGIVDKTKLAVGNYSLAQLKKLADKRWSDYDQKSLDKSIDSMPTRLAAVITRQGEYLMKGEDY